jgi:hypothetical protein
MDDQLSSLPERIDGSKSRRWTRFPPDKSETWVIAKDERMSATICDESFGGIGVTIDMADAANVQVGDQLIVLHYDYPTPGRVQWIERDQEAKLIRLGIRWSS